MRPTVDSSREAVDSPRRRGIASMGRRSTDFAIANLLLKQ